MYSKIFPRYTKLNQKPKKESRSQKKKAEARKRKQKPEKESGSQKKKAEAKKRKRKARENKSNTYLTYRIYRKCLSNPAGLCPQACAGVTAQECQKLLAFWTKPGFSGMDAWKRELPAMDGRCNSRSVRMPEQKNRMLRASSIPKPEHRHKPADTIRRARSHSPPSDCPKIALI